MATGEFEVIASEIVILNQAKTPPFQIEDDQAIRHLSAISHASLLISGLKTI